MPQLVRNSTPCKAFLLFQLKAEIQTLCIFSRAAKATVSPIIWNFVLIQVYHFSLEHPLGNLEKEQLFLGDFVLASCGKLFHDSLILRSKPCKRSNLYAQSIKRGKRLFNAPNEKYT